MRTQMHNITLWANKKQQETGVTNKKILLTADDWNFNLGFEEGGTTQESRNNFQTKIEIKLNKDALKTFGALLSGFITKLKSNSFKKDQEMKDEVFYDGWMIVSDSGNMSIIRLLGGYKIINNMRVRLTVMKVYSCSGWDEVSKITESKKFDENKLLLSVDFPNKSIVRGAFTPQDRCDIELFVNIVDSILIGTNNNHFYHMQKMFEEKAGAEQSAANSHKSANVVSAVSENESSEDFPF
ncbi:MAG: hypothetical protein ACRC92_20615 [Peptostreptococcaceae bacterium]